MDIRNFFGGGAGATKGKIANKVSSITDMPPEKQQQTSSNNNNSIKKEEEKSKDDKFLPEQKLNSKLFESKPPVSKSSIDASSSRRVIADEDEEDDKTNEAKTALPPKVDSSEHSTLKHDMSSSNRMKGLENIITWSKGEPIPYKAIVETFEKVSSLSGRLDKEECFCKLFRAVICTTPNDLETVIYLTSNCLSPAYDGLELGIGDSLLIKAIIESTGRQREAVEESYRQEGDLGIVALQSRMRQKTLSFAAKPKPLLANEVKYYNVVYYLLLLSFSCSFIRCWNNFALSLRRKVTKHRVERSLLLSHC
jgi:hypothetical protein